MPASPVIMTTSPAGPRAARPLIAYSHVLRSVDEQDALRLVVDRLQKDAPASAGCAGHGDRPRRVRRQPRAGWPGWPAQDPRRAPEESATARWRSATPCRRHLAGPGRRWARPRSPGSASAPAQARRLLSACRIRSPRAPAMPMLAIAGSMASRSALPRRKLAQHAPFRSHLRQAWRRSPADRYLRQRHSHLRALRLGDWRALACSRPPGLPPSRSGSAPSRGPPSRTAARRSRGTTPDPEQCSRHSKHCNPEL